MKTIHDADMLQWEAWAIPARNGSPSPGVVAFRCLSDPSLRPRVVSVGNDLSEAEARVQAAAPAELRKWFDRARPIH